MSDLKMYLINWLLDNTDDGVLIAFDVNHSKAMFPFTPIPDTGIFIATIRYAMDFFMTPEGVSFLMSIAPSTGQVFIPMESVSVIFSETQLYVFHFQQKKPAPSSLPAVKRGLRVAQG